MCFSCSLISSRRSSFTLSLRSAAANLPLDLLSLLSPCLMRRSYLFCASVTLEVSSTWSFGMSNFCNMVKLLFAVSSAFLRLLSSRRSLSTWLFVSKPFSASFSLQPNFSSDRRRDSSSVVILDSASRSFCALSSCSNFSRSI